MSEWKTYLTKDLIADGKLIINDGYRAKNEELGASGFPFVRVGNLLDSGFQLDDVDRFPEENINKVGIKISRPGDVVLTTKGTVGRFAFIQQDTEKLLYSPQLSFWRVLDTNVIYPRFLYFWMRGREFQTQCNGVKGQTDMADFVSLTEQRLMKITLPPLPIQKRIAEILGRLDDKIELNRRINATLEDMAQRLYKHWFVDFGPFQEGEFVESELGLIPQGWRVGTLGDVAEIQRKSVVPQKTPNEIFNHYSIPALDKGQRPELDLGNTIQSSKFLIEKNCILLSKLNPRIYRVWTIYHRDDYRSVSSTEFIHYVNKKPNTWSFLNCYFRYNSFIKDFQSRVTGTTGSHQRVNPDETVKIPTIIPPESILVRFEKVVSLYFLQIEHNVHESNHLATIRDYLLPRLLSGELSVNPE